MCCYEILCQWSGFIAGCLSTVTLVPQIIKTYQTNSAKDIALGSVFCFFFAAIFWVMYGITINSQAILITNTFQFIFATILLWLKVRPCSVK